MLLIIFSITTLGNRITIFLRTSDAANLIPYSIICIACFTTPGAYLFTGFKSVIDELSTPNKSCNQSSRTYKGSFLIASLNISGIIFHDRLTYSLEDNSDNSTYLTSDLLLRFITPCGVLCCFIFLCISSYRKASNALFWSSALALVLKLPYILLSTLVPFKSIPKASS